MGFCIYHKDLLTDQLADEIILPISLDSDIKRIEEYLKGETELAHNQRYIFSYRGYCCSNTDKNALMSFINAFKNQFNLTIRFFEPERVDKEFLKELTIPYFFETKCYNAYEVAYFEHLGASDIYIGGPLAFSLKSMQGIREKIKIRVMVDDPEDFILERWSFPYISTGFTYEKLFWIRPEDAALYMQYADTLEISQSRYTATLIDIYNKGRWEGRLEDVLHKKLPYSAYNCNIPPVFGTSRLNCGWKCGLGVNCNICTECMEFAQKLTDMQLEIRKVENEQQSCN